MSEGDDMLDAVGEADIIANLGVYFGRDSFVDDALNGHILEDIFEGKIERNHVLVVLNQLAILLQQCLLLHHQLFVESDCLDVLLQRSN